MHSRNKCINRNIWLERSADDAQLLTKNYRIARIMKPTSLDMTPKEDPTDGDTDT